MNFIKKSLFIVLIAVILGGAAFLIWAGDLGDFEAPSPRDYAPNFWFDSEENYYPVTPFFYTDDFEEISGAEAKTRYDSLSFEQKMDKFKVFYHIAESDNQWVYEYWLYYVYNNYKHPVFGNKHYHDWESVFVFVNKDTRRATKVVGSAHQGEFMKGVGSISPGAPLNNEFFNPQLKKDEHIWVYVEEGGHANCPDEEPDGWCNPTNLGAWGIGFGWSDEDKLNGRKIRYSEDHYRLEEINNDFINRFRTHKSFPESPNLAKIFIYGLKKKIHFPGGSPPPHPWYEKRFDNPEEISPPTTQLVMDKIKGLGAVVWGKIQGTSQLVKDTTSNIFSWARDTAGSLFGWVENSFSELTAQIGSIFKGSESEGDYIPLDSVYPSLPLEEDDRGLKSATPDEERDADDRGLKSATPDDDRDLKVATPDEATPDERKEKIEEDEEEKRVSGRVIINEIAWMGTEASYNDEWIEFYNLESYPINLSGWSLKAQDGSPEIELSGTIEAQGYYLLERSDDNTISDIPANQIYTGSLSNNGENLILSDYSGAVIDQVDCLEGWFAGDNASKKTMERTNRSDRADRTNKSDRSDWHTNDGLTINGQDADSNAILGTPKAENSEGQSEEEGEKKEEEENIEQQEKDKQEQDEESGEEEKDDRELKSATPEIVINEIMYDLEGTDSGREWVEIYNFGQNSVNLSGWRFYENETDHRLSLYKSNKSDRSDKIDILSNGYAVIADNPEKFLIDNPNYSGILLKSSFSLKNSGELIAIRDSNLNDIDQLIYSSEWGARGDRNSSQRISPSGDSDTSSNWQAGIPTPGALNLTKGAFSSGGGGGSSSVYSSSGESSEQEEEGAGEGGGEESVVGERDGVVVINEIAWMGTEAEASDEWIELYNLETYAINLFGWALEAQDGSPEIELSGEIPAQGYYLLERTDDNTISDITADQTYAGALSNNGENLILSDYNGAVVDQVDCSKDWFAGENNPQKRSMERTDPLVSSSNSENWHTSSIADLSPLLHYDADGSPILGTPKALNSVPQSEEEGAEEESEEESENPEGSTLPTASFTYFPQNPTVDETITFNASSTDSIISFSWDFGDNNSTIATSSIITHFYATSSDYIVGLTVMDDTGATASATSTVSVSAAEEEAEEEEEEEESFEFGTVIINEIAWMGTEASSADEWIELFNSTSSPVDIKNWSIFGADTGECLNFFDADGNTTTVIPAYSYLIYANHEDDVRDSDGASIVDIWDATIGLNNSSPGQLVLYDAPNCGGNVIDIANQATGDWFIEENEEKKTMERNDSLVSGSIETNWHTNNSQTINSLDADGNLILGTPKAQNSEEQEEDTTPPTPIFTIIPDWWTATTTVAWTLEGSPYILESNNSQYPTVEKGATLIIEPGVIIKGKNKHYPSLLIKGTLEAEGTAEEPIIFTANTENPEPGDWKGIVFEGSQGSVLDYVNFEYGGFESDEMIRVEDSEIAISNSTFRDSTGGIIYAIDSVLDIEDSTFLTSEGGIYARGDAAAITVANSEFKDLGFYGIKAKNGAFLELEDNLFVDITKYPIEITSAYPSLSGNLAENCGVNGVYFNSNSVFGQDFTLKSDLPYVLQSNLGEQVTVAEGVTLTLEPGVVLKAALSGGGIPQQYDTLLVKGTLIAEGEQDASTKIVFTSFKDDEYGGDANNDGNATQPAPGDWKRIVFASSSTGSVLENVLLRYGGLEDEIITIEGETEEADEEEVLDQNAITPSSAPEQRFGDTTYYGQTFIIGEGVDNIKKFRAYLRKSNTGTVGEIFADIYQGVDGEGRPIGNSLGQASIDGGAALSTDFSWTSFVFAPEIPLNAHRQYVVVLKNTGDPSTGHFKIFYSENYEGGNIVRSLNFGENWRVISKYDLMFQTWYLPPANTESSKVDMINIEKEYCL